MYNVMLVDDERWVRTSLRHMLEETQLPFQIVYECSNGREALEWQERHSVDLILSDVKMPVMDGIMLAEQLREKKPNIHVILVSGHGDFQFVQKAIRNGVHDYLLKPVGAEELQDCLQRYLTNRGYDPSEQSTIKQILKLIYDAMPGNISLTEIAAKVHLNSSYVSQLFKKEMNRKFIDYVLEVRMEEAKKLLTRTSLRISEVAERLDYDDLAYFSNTFKKIVGRTPNQFRKDSKEELTEGPKSRRSG